MNDSQHDNLDSFSPIKSTSILNYTYIYRLNLCSRLRLKYDGTRLKTRFRLPAKRTNPFKSAVASVQSTTGSRGVRISGSNVGYTMFRGSVKSTGYPLHSPVSPSLPLPCFTVCHHVSTGLHCSNSLCHSCLAGPWLKSMLGRLLYSA
jgi:hypothetical protein